MVRNEQWVFPVWKKKKLFKSEKYYERNAECYYMILELSPALQTVNVPTICNQKYAKVYSNGIITNGTICTDTSGGKGTCLVKLGSFNFSQVLPITLILNSTFQRVILVDHWLSKEIGLMLSQIHANARLALPVLSLQADVSYVTQQASLVSPTSSMVLSLKRPVFLHVMNVQTLI